MSNEKNMYSYTGTEEVGQSAGLSNFFNKVFLIMMVGVLITFGVTYATLYFAPKEFLLFIFNYYLLFLILELAVVLFLRFRVSKMSYTGVVISFMVYATLTGFTFVVICGIAGSDIFTQALLTTAGYFAILAVYGFVTKKDLSVLRNTLSISLIAIIVLSLINLFVGSDSVDFFLTLATLVVFTGYTMYDVHILKNFYLEASSTNANGINLNKVAAYGALMLYLDFINLFLSILDLFQRFSGDN